MHMLSGKDQSSAELETVRFSENPITVATEMGSPRRAVNRRRRTREGPEPALWEGGTRGKRGRINVPPWYRHVGVVKVPPADAPTWERRRD